MAAYSHQEAGEVWLDSSSESSCDDAGQPRNKIATSGFAEKIFDYKHMNMSGAEVDIKAVHMRVRPKIRKVPLKPSCVNARWRNRKRRSPSPDLANWRPRRILRQERKIKKLLDAKKANPNRSRPQGLFISPLNGLSKCILTPEDNVTTIEKYTEVLEILAKNAEARREEEYKSLFLPRPISTIQEEPVENVHSMSQLSLNKTHRNISPLSNEKQVSDLQHMFRRRKDIDGEVDGGHSNQASVTQNVAKSQHFYPILPSPGPRLNSALRQMNESQQRDPNLLSPNDEVNVGEMVPRLKSQQNATITTPHQLMNSTLPHHFPSAQQMVSPPNPILMQKSPHKTVHRLSDTTLPYDKSLYKASVTPCQKYQAGTIEMTLSSQKSPPILLSPGLTKTPEQRKSPYEKSAHHQLDCAPPSTYTSKQVASVPQVYAGSTYTSKQVASVPQVYAPPEPNYQVFPTGTQPQETSVCQTDGQQYDPEFPSEDIDNSPVCNVAPISAASKYPNFIVRKATPAKSTLTHHGAYSSNYAFIPEVSQGSYRRLPDNKPRPPPELRPGGIKRSQPLKMSTSKPTAADKTMPGMMKCDPIATSTHIVSGDYSSRTSYPPSSNYERSSISSHVNFGTASSDKTNHHGKSSSQPTSTLNHQHRSSYPPGPPSVMLKHGSQSTATNTTKSGYYPGKNSGKSAEMNTKSYKHVPQNASSAVVNASIDNVNRDPRLAKYKSSQYLSQDDVANLVPQNSTSKHTSKDATPKQESNKSKQDLNKNKKLDPNKKSDSNKQEHKKTEKGGKPSKEKSSSQKASSKPKTGKQPNYADEAISSSTADLDFSVRPNDDLTSGSNPGIAEENEPRQKVSSKAQIYASYLLSATLGFAEGAVESTTIGETSIEISNNQTEESVVTFDEVMPTQKSSPTKSKISNSNPAIDKRSHTQKKDSSSKSKATGSKPEENNMPTQSSKPHSSTNYLLNEIFGFAECDVETTYESSSAENHTLNMSPTDLSEVFFNSVISEIATEKHSPKRDSPSNLDSVIDAVAKGSLPVVPARETPTKPAKSSFFIPSRRVSPKLSPSKAKLVKRCSVVVENKNVANVLTSSLLKNLQNFTEKRSETPESKSQNVKKNTARSNQHPSLKNKISNLKTGMVDGSSNKKSVENKTQQTTSTANNTVPCHSSVASDKNSNSRKSSKKPSFTGGVAGDESHVSNLALLNFKSSSGKNTKTSQSSSSSKDKNNMGKSIKKPFTFDGASTVKNAPQQTSVFKNLDPRTQDKPYTSSSLDDNFDYLDEYIGTFPKFARSERPKKLGRPKSSDKKKPPVKSTWQVSPSKQSSESEDENVALKLIFKNTPNVTPKKYKNVTAKQRREESEECVPKGTTWRTLTIDTHKRSDDDSGTSPEQSPKIIVDVSKLSRKNLKRPFSGAQAETEGSATKAKRRCNSPSKKDEKQDPHNPVCPECFKCFLASNRGHRVMWLECLICKQWFHDKCTDLEDYCNECVKELKMSKRNKT